MKRELGPELPSELRAELARSRRAGHDYDVLANLPRLRAALDAAAHAPADGGSADASTSGALHAAPAAWKIAVLIAAVGTTALGAWSLQRRQPAATAPAPAPQHVAPPAEPQPSVQAVAPAPSAAAPAAPEPAAPNPVVAAQPESNAQPAARSSRREIAQLVRIRALLERDPNAAYRLAQQSEREFPRGVLSEERQALQVLALAKSGDLDGAKQRAQAFFARYPQSPMRELLEEALRR
jgi:type IV secretory pathway VirB10-like protein